MQVFLSWSGVQSKAVAESLRNLLPDLLHDIQIWMSEHDLKAGGRWSTELSECLSKSDVGIACVTNSNQHSPWLMFEAGAISKSLSEGRLIPYLFEIGPEQIDYPLAQFQMRTTDRQGTFMLANDLNAYSQNPIEATRFNRVFDRWWPDFEAALIRLSLHKETIAALPQRTDKEILYEILDKVRNISFSQPIIATHKNEISVDTRPLLGENGEIVIYTVSQKLLISNFLDDLWGKIHKIGNIPAYSYGETWILYSLTLDNYLPDLGYKYIKSLGIKRDLRSLEQIGIPLGDSLEVRSIP